MTVENTNLNILAGRLVEARRRSGLTQEVVAERLGCSRPTFIAIEKGTRRPRPSELASLATIYGVPLNELLRDAPLPTDIKPHLRGAAESAEEPNDEVKTAVDVLTSFVDDYQTLERMLGEQPFTNFPPAVRIPSGSLITFAEHRAQEERARLKLGDQPVLQLRKILEEEVGVRTFMWPLGRSLAGLYGFVPTFGHCILVNRLHPRTRRRWTIAHEYGHFLTERERPGVDYLKAPQRKSLSERFADSFAAAFLMPETGVRRHFFDVVNRSNDFKVSDLCWLADLYDVSFAALTLRLENLNLIAKGTWEDLVASKVKPTEVRKELGLSEPAQADSGDVFPERYKLLAVRAFVEGRISEGLLTKFLRCDRLRAREIVAECSIGSADDETSGVSTLPLAQSVLADRGAANA